MAIELTKLTIMLIDNQTDGIKLCDVEGESLMTVVIPREKLADAKKLPDIPQRGIYYLLDEDHGILSRVYAGKTTQGLSRLDSHKSKKDFWNKAVMFLDSDRNIDKDVLDCLEAKAIDYIQTHGDYKSDNGDNPKPHINPYKEGAIERLHQSILFRMSALGFDLDRTYAGPINNTMLFHARKKGINGLGFYNKETGHFTVCEGSQVDLNHAIIKNKSATEARTSIFRTEAGIVTLQHDIEFNSPSSAAVFVLGGSQNGWIEWLNDAGQTLNEVYRQN